jgi:hypothetical protein
MRESEKESKRERIRDRKREIFIYKILFYLNKEEFDNFRHNVLLFIKFRIVRIKFQKLY